MHTPSFRPETNQPPPVTQTPPAKVLVVDDEKRILSSLKILLEQRGFQVDTARGGITACEKLAPGTFDLVLLDLLMDDLSGQQVMRFMAEQSINTAIIIISVEASFSAVSHALRRGADDYLKKPFSTRELLSSTERVLAKKLAEQKQTENQQRLRKSELLQSYLLDNSPDIVFMLDNRGCFTFINSAVEKRLGYTRERLQGEHFSALLSAGEVVKLKEYITEIKRGNNFSEVEIKMRGKLKNQHLKHFELSAFPLFEDSIAKSGQLERFSSAPDSAKKFIGIYGSAKDITDRKEAQDYISFQAYHDLLTRLPNRRLFYDRLNMAIAHGRRNNNQLAVLFLDLDGFKQVNDKFGHTMGDQLLQAVATRLLKCLREGDTLSRFGGDEFVLLLPAIKDLTDAREVAHKIISFVNEPFTLNDQELHIGISIGIAIYPDAGDNIDQLIRNADIAMYFAKDSKEESFQIYDESLMATTTQRLKTEKDLHKALQKDQFEVYYQPQLDAVSGNIFAVEALLRWHHPERGILYPDQFMAIAEEAGLFSSISEWVMSNACQQVRQWMDAGFQHLKLVVNLATSQVAQPGLVPTLMKILEQNNFPPTKLELELSEEVIIKDLEALTSILTELSNAGIRMTIDGFGTRYSSLGWLRKLPIHSIKVDKTFIHEIQNDSEIYTIKGIAAMAHGLNLKIVAGSVETEVQLNYLKKVGCHYVQGFIFAEAKSAGEMFKLLDKNLLLTANAS